MTDIIMNMGPLMKIMFVIGIGMMVVGGLLLLRVCVGLYFLYKMDRDHD